METNRIESLLVKWAASVRPLRHALQLRQLERLKLLAWQRLVLRIPVFGIRHLRTLRSRARSAIASGLLLLAPDQFSREDDALDVTCPLINLQTLNVPIIALDGIFTRIAAIAIEQDRLGRRPGRRFGRKQ